MARGIIRDDTEAEDMLQEAYLHAYQRLDTLTGAAALPLWLGRTVVNEALGRLRRRPAVNAALAAEHQAIAAYQQSVSTTDSVHRTDICTRL